MWLPWATLAKWPSAVAGIVEEAQRDPAGSELVLGAVVVPARDGGVARDTIGGLGLAEIEQLAGNEPPLDPPLVGVDRLSVVGWNGQDQLGGLFRLVGAAEQLDAAEDVTDVAMRVRRHRVKQGGRVGGLLDHRDARVGDHRGVAAGAIGRAQPALGILRIEAHIHARLVVGGGDQVGEDVEHAAFELAREVVVAPGFAHQALRGGAVALQQERAGEGELALRGGRLVLAEEGAHEGRIGAVRPQRRLGAATQQPDGGPVRILRDEGHVAADADAIGLVAAQDRPFDQLARDRVGDRLLQVAGLRRPASTGGGDRLLQGSQVRRRDRLARGGSGAACGVRSRGGHARLGAGLRGGARGPRLRQRCRAGRIGRQRDEHGPRQQHRDRPCWCPIDHVRPAPAVRYLFA